ncbi:hypothetical protein [Rubricoccus marinus]|uniref:Uncharacterized protein n=1 Tax=Rubricoccus marinus TaxID=716817 RepID=A0A259TUV0_9BACT|nr:hypothetical protein [Rubricoccus marinus]OZC01354.1 hypothetical protein BSZ36_18110 [Rubricoccus marinus]
MSFLSRFSWCLAAVGPSLLYGPVAALLAWACVTGGWSLHGWVPSVQSAAAVPCGLLSVVFGGLVASEWQHAASIRRLVARQAAIGAAGR